MLSRALRFPFLVYDFVPRFRQTIWLSIQTTNGGFAVRTLSKPRFYGLFLHKSRF
jgi:hypothetical protein